MATWGGYRPFSKSAEGKTWCDGYRYNTISGSWSKIIGMPYGTMVGASCVSLPDGRVLCIGGVNSEVFQDALVRRDQIAKGIGDRDSLKQADQTYMNQHASKYKFNNKLYIYNPVSDAWTEVAESERFARAGAGMVLMGDDLYIINGERKPGVRVTDVWKVSVSAIKGQKTTN